MYSHLLLTESICFGISFFMGSRYVICVGNLWSCGAIALLLPIWARALPDNGSALFFAEELPLHFHLFVDAEGAKDMEHSLGQLEPWSLAQKMLGLC